MNQQQQDMPRRASATTKILQLFFWKKESEPCKIICWSIVCRGIRSDHPWIVGCCFSRLWRHADVPCGASAGSGSIAAWHQEFPRHFWALSVWHRAMPRGSDCHVGGHGRRFCRYLLKRPNWRTRTCWIFFDVIALNLGYYRYPNMIKYDDFYIRISNKTKLGLVLYLDNGRCKSWTPTGMRDGYASHQLRRMGRDAADRPLLTWNKVHS